MLTFTLAISCLTTSNLPWLMDLTFLVPMQNRSCVCKYLDVCSLYNKVHPFWVHRLKTFNNVYSCAATSIVKLNIISIPHSKSPWYPLPYYAQSCPTLWDPMDCSPSTPLSIEISRQEYWSGLPFPIPGDPPHPGIKPTSLASCAPAGRFFTSEPPGKLISLISDISDISDIYNLSTQKHQFFSFSYPRCEKYIQRQSMFACLSKLAWFPGVSHIHVYFISQPGMHGIFIICTLTVSWPSLLKFSCKFLAVLQPIPH